MVWQIIAALLLLIIAFYLWKIYSDSINKDIIRNLKYQLDNLIKTYNDDTNDLNNKLQDALWAKHNLTQEVVKLKWELIDAKKTISTLKCKEYTKKIVVNNTDNTVHTSAKKRWRPRKYSN